MRDFLCPCSKDHMVIFQNMDDDSGAFLVDTEVESNSDGGGSCAADDVRFWNEVSGLVDRNQRGKSEQQRNDESLQ